ncbi:hypothetical protein, partial [Caulobacter sp.]|uniref:hypothetical protein n=1 Tax=Caulobacter sp. TaxID=78 RepID=UPI002B4A94E6
MTLFRSNPMAARRRGSAILRYALILASLVFLPVPASAQAASDPAKREALAMTNQEAWKIYEKYLSAWNTTSVEERL